MTFNSENIHIFYPNVPTQNGSYNCGAYCLKYITMLYLHRQWDFLAVTNSEIVGGLSTIMKFQNLETIHYLRVSIKEGVKSLASSNT